MVGLLAIDAQVRAAGQIAQEGFPIGIEDHRMRLADLLRLQVQVSIAPGDIEWERMRAGGAGGQHVNKTESAVRIWYRKGKSDEMEVKCQDGRSQGKNYEQAMRILRSRLFERTQERLHKERADARKSLIGSGDRSARIRTYNFSENRCTDHRIGHTVYKMDVVLAGDLDLMIEPM